MTKRVIASDVKGLKATSLVINITRPQHACLRPRSRLCWSRPRAIWPHHMRGQELFVSICTKLPINTPQGQD